MTWNASYRLELLFKVISVLTPRGTNWRKAFQSYGFQQTVKWSGGHLPEHHRVHIFGLTDWITYVLSNWLTHLKTKLIVSLIDLPANQVLTYFMFLCTLWIFTTCYLKINNRQIKWLNLTSSRKVKDESILS